MSRKKKKKNKLHMPEQGVLQEITMPAAAAQEPPQPVAAVPVIEVEASPIVEPMEMPQPPRTVAVVPVVEVQPSPVVTPIRADEMAVEPPLALSQEALPQEALPQEALPQEALPQEALPQEALPQETLPQAAMVETAPPTADKPLGDYMRRLNQRFTAFLEKPRKSQQDMVEDEEKFGVEDSILGELESEPELPHPVRQRLQSYKRTLAERRSRAASSTQEAVRETRKRGGSFAATLSASMDELRQWAFEECYYIGVLLLRYASDLRRQGFRAFVWVRYTIPPFFSRKRLQLLRVADAIAESCTEPFRDIVVKTRSMRYRVANRTRFAEGGKSESPVGIVARYVYSLGRPLNRVSSFLLPILGCAVLAATVLYFQQINYALEVQYNGVKIGCIERESDFYEAQNLMYERLLNEDYAASQDTRPTFKLVITQPENVMDVDALTNRIMSVTKTDVVVADGIYIDGAFLGAVEDGSEFLLYIDGILTNYRTKTAHERVQFVKKVTVQQGIYPQSSLKPVHEIKNAVESNESLPQLHKVVEEETLESIAVANNTTVDAVLKLNPMLQARIAGTDDAVPRLVTGEEVLINKVELSLGIQVTRRESYTEAVSFGTDYTDVNNMPDSYTATIANGIKGERLITADITYVDGQKTNETVLTREVTREPVNARVKRGTLKPAQFIAQATGGASSSLMWPVAGGYVSAGLYGYWGHTGMGIAAPYGTGIYAAADGTVTYAVNYSNGSYGKRVDISHGGGITTRYAHCSEVLVKTGQYVQQGQLIAKIGRTGNATGNHCHLEVRVNGAIMNPASFVGSRFPGY